MPGRSRGQSLSSKKPHASRRCLGTSIAAQQPQELEVAASRFFWSPLTPSAIRCRRGGSSAGAAALLESFHEKKQKYEHLRGVPANFFVFYEIDEDESKHSLELTQHGHQEVPSAWVLLERVPEESS
jgi:hypothetical protein